MLRLAVVVVLSCLWFAVQAQSSFPAGVKPQTWRVQCTGTSTWWAGPAPFPDDPKATCEKICQSWVAYSSAYSHYLGTGEFVHGPHTNPGNPVQSHEVGAGLQTTSKFYGSCMCAGNVMAGPAAGQMSCTGGSKELIIADAECGGGGAVPLSSYAPAYCSTPGQSQTPDPASTCAATLNVGTNPQKMLKINDDNTVPNGCLSQCLYGPPASGQGAVVTVGGTRYLAGTWLGKGLACPFGTPGLIDVLQDADAASGQLALEATQLQNKGLLAQILSALGQGTGGGSTNTGGDLDRIATAVEAQASAASAAAASDAAILAEAADIQSAADVHERLPQRTVDFATALSAVEVNAFGQASCPAPRQLVTVGTTTHSFDYSTMCNVLGSLGGLLMACSAFVGAREAIA
jgi:hypothetical protein